jgi:hypothetical protein
LIAGELRGPFHGVIAATTPTGSRTTRLRLVPSVRTSSSGSDAIRSA